MFGKIFGSTGVTTFCIIKNALGDAIPGETIFLLHVAFPRACNMQQIALKMQHRMQQTCKKIA
jgi:hypothetical protein